MNNVATVNKPSYNEFLIKLKIGQAYEAKSIAKLIQFYKDKYTLVETNNDNRYDFKLSNGKAYEIKADLLAVTTGFIFVENVQFNKPSGIDVTKASYYIIIVSSSNMFRPNDHVFYKLSVPRLKQLIVNSRYDRYYTDTNKAGYLFSIDVIARNSAVL